MSDYIDRQAVIDILAAMQGQCTTKAALIQNSKIWKQIKGLPSAQIEQQWRVIEKRPMDAEERDYWEGMHNCDYSDGVIYTNIPDDGQKVLVCYYNGAIDIDEFVNDNYGCYFDSNGDMEGIVAWMPKPKPYKGEGEEE